ncbi:MAG: penicillin acylase family protein [Candidatus Korobacteraceae bacterium]
MGASTIATRARPSNSKFIFRAVVGVLVLLLIVFLAFDFWFYRAVRAALPQVDGTVHLSGLASPVVVTYDALGVPNIVAANLPDLFFAQGYVTAQDRLWQMDMTRRYASGDLAAVLGPEYVKLDREHRILGLRQVAERNAANMDVAQRAHFEAYAAGVNAYIAQHQKTLPLEFRFLTYFPHVWTVEDSVLVGLSMTEFLNHGLYKDELEKEKVLAKLGPELTADLFVNSSWRDHPPGTDTTSLENEIPAGTTPDEEEDPAPRKKSSHVTPGLKPQIPRLGRRGDLAQDDKNNRGLYGVLQGTPLPPEGAPLQSAALEDSLHPGSNNWVVSGAHTASGKPLLSNDMHLDLHIPNVWYEAHLTAGDFDVAGVTLPGVPFVIAGHNRSIAWGFTNLGPNVEDLYIEKFNDKGEYLTPQGWVQPEHRKEIIRVKGKPEVNVDVEITRHGPIISDIIPGEKRKLALKWIIYDPQAAGAPFFAVDSAKNWQDFRAAFSHFGAPGQNVVYADVEGHIGYQAAGLVPIRAAADGSVPVPGDDDSHAWTGYVPYDKLPSVYDPASGIIATANGRITPDGYPYTVSIEWGSPYRTERIYKLLNAIKKLTPSDMLAIQTDIVSAFDRFCAERFVYAVDHTATASQRAKSAADLMRNWDGTMSTDSAAATAAYFSRKKLEELLLKPKLGDDWKQYTGLLAVHPKWFMSAVWLENILSHQPARWLPAGYADYDALLTAAVEGAVSDAEAPHALATWRWGRVHRVDIKHPFWSNFPILKRAAGPGPQPLSGDGETVKQVSAHFGPSERLTVDFSDLDNSTLSIVNGQSGNIFDEHYNDQWDAYYHGQTFALPFSAAAVQRAGVHHLKLEP